MQNYSANPGAQGPILTLLIQKMKMYLELEGRLGPKLRPQPKPSHDQPSDNQVPVPTPKIPIP